MLIDGMIVMFECCCKDENFLWEVYV